MREAELRRTTKETDIFVKWNLDQSGKCDVDTGIGFFDHMLELLAVHSGTLLTVGAKGDLNVDSHHTVEDVGIVLGKVFKEALGDKAGIKRYGSFLLPMDESLVSVCMDVSGRPYFVFNCDIPKTQIGNFETEMCEEFFRAFAFNAEINLHINLLYGKNCHHMIEGIFKAFAHSLKEAVTVDSNISGVLSSKGVL